MRSLIPPENLIPKATVAHFMTLSIVSLGLLVKRICTLCVCALGVCTSSLHCGLDCTGAPTYAASARSRAVTKALYPGLSPTVSGQMLCLPPRHRARLRVVGVV